MSSRDDWISRASSGPEPLNALKVSRSRSCNRLLPTLLTNVVGLAQKTRDVLADRGVLLVDVRPVAQPGLRRIIRRHQVDVLLTDRRDALHRRGDILGYGCVAVQPHMGDDTVVRQADRFHPPDGHTAIGDVGVLVKTAARQRNSAVML